MQPSKTNRDRITEMNFELFFATEVLKLNSLHYGYWDDGKRASPRIDLDEVRRAQSRFTEKLIERIPTSAETVLDVGAGVGDNARALARHGLRVMAISPDRNHARYFAEIDDPNVVFERSTFEAFETAERFDLVLFSESHRYIDHQLGLSKARELLRPGGHLLVSGMFRNRDKAPFPLTFELADLPYVRSAEAAGFRPIELRDITPNVFPTIEIVDQAISEILEPTLRFAETYAMARSPWKTRLFRLLVAREDKELTRVLRKLRRKTDPERFLERFRYATTLFEVR